jgi:protein transport protein HofC
MFAIVLIALFLAAAVQYWQAMLFVGVFLLPPGLVIGGFVLLAKRRATYQEALLRVMAIASERRMPLAPGIEAFADLCGGEYRRKALALAYLLDAGVPLPQALANVPGVLPRPAVILACVGWSEGALATALREAVAANEVRKNFRYAFIPKIAYVGGVLMVVQAILSFIMYFITPKFEAIFKDFGVTLPDMTVATIRASHWVVGSGLILFLVPIELALLLYVPFSYFGWIRWDLPFLDRMLGRRDAAALLRSLAINVSSGRPLTSAIRLLADFYPRSWVRSRLRKVHFEIESGQTWHTSLRRHRLIRKGDAAVLESAERAGNLGWALRVLADANDRSLGYRLQALSQILFPVVVALMGVLVAFLAVAYFLPLVRLIETLA